MDSIKIIDLFGLGDHVQDNNIRQKLAEERNIRKNAEKITEKKEFQKKLYGFIRCSIGKSECEIGAKRYEIISEKTEFKIQEGMILKGKKISLSQWNILKKSYINFALVHSSQYYDIDYENAFPCIVITDPVIAEEAEKDFELLKNAHERLQKR